MKVYNKRNIRAGDWKGWREGEGGGGGPQNDSN